MELILKLSRQCLGIKREISLACLRTGRILTVARLSAEKRIDPLFFSHFRKVVEQHGNDVWLYVLGTGLNERDSRDFRQSIPEDKVTFVGAVAHAAVPVWLSAADVFCLSSDWEGCPVSIIEAMGCGRPVVSTNVGSVPDLVTGEAFGFLVPPGCPDKLADALLNALDRSWRHKEISELGGRTHGQRLPKKCWEDSQEFKITCSNLRCKLPFKKVIRSKFLLRKTDGRSKPQRSLYQTQLGINPLGRNLLADVESF